ncbi:asparagine synthetase B, partial [Acinetobacter baumannii]
MCGLYLSVGLKPDRSALMRAAHRGPDGVGWRVFDTPAGPLAMGHLRLAIIDPLPRSEQPMADDELRFWLTLNGEIYNYRELRTELALEGVQFHT